METFSYDDKLSKLFVHATIIWGVVGMLVGVIVALQLGIANKSSTHAVIDEFFTLRTTTLN